jgi:A/G-specific adenine glycosylase
MRLLKPAMTEAGASLNRDLLAWYDVNRRSLPWRAEPGHAPDPYGVWLSEIMLQQTTVPAVIPYFRRFRARWPSVESLAEATLDDILKEWAGLGYYARARNLHACAQTIVTAYNGRFPQSSHELAKLPGIGPYTAAAIAAIAFDEGAAAIDGNAERVITRLFAIETELPRAKTEIAQMARTLVPRYRPGDFAQALMDLGATICTPKSPNCGLCPLRISCRGRAAGIAESLPRKAPRPVRPVRHGTAYWIERSDGAILLRRRKEEGLLGGMMEIPSSPWLAERPDGMRAAPLKADWRRNVARLEHSFTHFHLVLDIWRAIDVRSGELLDEGDYRWVTPDRLGEEALPSVMRKIVGAMLASVRSE